MSLKPFNNDLLNDRLNEYRANLERALEQHRLLSVRLNSTKIRLKRAIQQGRKSFSYKYSMQMSCISGTMCMYEEYMKRKSDQINKLQTFQRHLNVTSKYQQVSGQPEFTGGSSNIKDAGDNANNEDRTNSAEQKHSCSSMEKDIETNETVSTQCSKGSRKRKYPDIDTEDETKQTFSEKETAITSEV